MESQSITPSDDTALIAKPTSSKHYFQVDAFKAVMIFLVIMDHTFTHHYLSKYLSTFWERISIPMLVIIMGYNMGISFKKKGYTTIKQLYSLKYFESKLKRYIAPFLILYAAHTILYLLERYTGMTTLNVAYYESPYNVYIGYTPFYGPGSWFLPALFSTILIFPALYWCYLQKPALTLVSTFVIEFGWRVMTYYFYNVFDYTDPARITSSFFGCHIFNMFSAIGLGLWFSTDHDLYAKRNIWMWSLLPLSLLYMFQYVFLGNWLRYNLLFFSWITGDYHLFFFPYSGFLFLVGMKFIPENPEGKYYDWVRRISRSTYHILLTQIFYFSIVYQFFLVMYDGNPYTLDVFDAAPENYGWFFILNLAITFSGGMLWNELETRYYKKKKETKNQQLMYKGIIGISATFFIIRMILIVVFFIKYPIA
ncbi:acyltransferase family protein [Candidatus Lokiarchaeum ossiferum]